MKSVCFVIGAGAGIGGNVGRRFAREGYHACLCRRTDETMALKFDSKERITGLSASFKGTANLKMWLGHGACSLKKVEYRNSFKERATLELVAESTP